MKFSHYTVVLGKVNQALLTCSVGCQATREGSKERCISSLVTHSPSLATNHDCLYDVVKGHILMELFFESLSSSGNHLWIIVKPQWQVAVQPVAKQ